MKRSIYIAVLQILASLFACDAFANSDRKPLIHGTLMVGYSDSSMNPVFNDEFLSIICDGIGAKMTQDSGVFGLGIF